MPRSEGFIKIRIFRPLERVQGKLAGWTTQDALVRRVGQVGQQEPEVRDEGAELLPVLGFDVDVVEELRSARFSRAKSLRDWKTERRVRRHVFARRRMGPIMGKSSVEDSGGA